MQKYQDILRDQSSRAFARQTVDTSLLLLPLRLETQIMQRNRGVAPEPARGLYVFKALWALIERLIAEGEARQGAGATFRSSALDHATAEVRHSISSLVEALERTDTLYPQDKTLLTELCQNLSAAIPTIELQDAFAPVLATLAKVSAPSSLTDSRVVALLGNMERTTRLFERTALRPLYSGHRRSTQTERYSQTARHRTALRHYREVSRGMERINRDVELFYRDTVTPAQCNRYDDLCIRWRAALSTLAYEIRKDIKGRLTREQVVVLLMRRHSYDINDVSILDYASLEQQLGALRSQAQGKTATAALRNQVAAYEALYRFVKQTLAPQIIDYVESRWQVIARYFTTCSHRPDARGKIPPVKVRYTRLVTNLLQTGIHFVRMAGAPDSAKRAAIRKTIKAALRKVDEKVALSYYNYIDECRFTASLAAGINGLMQQAHLQRRIPVDAILSATPMHRAKISRTMPHKSLCVRIYPDVVALTQTAREISLAEYHAGKDFWLKYIYRQDKAYHESLWLALCDMYPAYRAAFILKRTFPRGNYKVMVRRARDMREHGFSLEEFVTEIDTNFVNSFPTTYVDNGERLFSVPVTDLLPTRFVVHAEVAIGDSTRTIVRYGHRLPDSVQVGLDMNDLEHSIIERTGASDTPQLYLSGGLRWMTDYAEAERMGMAVTVPLDAMAKGRGGRQRNFQFRSIYVYGLHDATPDEASQLIGQLMTAHLYSGKALELLPFDAATNILTGDDEAYAYDSSEQAQRERFKWQPENCVSPRRPAPAGDLDIIERLFCLPESVLSGVARPDCPEAAEVQLARTVNRLMTKYLTSPELAPAINPLLAAIKADPVLADYLYNDVLARGPFPMLRIGDQPYGVLPACDFRYLAVRASHPLSVVKKILMLLTVHWNNILATNVTDCYAGDRPQASLTTQDYLSILGTTPQTTSFYARKMVEGDIIDPAYFRGEEWNGQFKELYDIARTLGLVTSLDQLLAIVPGYQAVPIVESPNDGPEVAASVGRLTDALNLDNIVRRLKKDLSEINAGSTTGLTLPTDDTLLGRMAVEFFDLFNYRLDAWLMGLLANKLRTRTREGRHRLALGCFGWVFNLKENDGFKLGCTDEYILAPSVGQAVTGAILRSSYNNSVKEGQPHDYDMGVNLSSERVRTAIRIIHGIQNGLSLGAILGADLERFIHEAWKTPQPDITGTPDGLELDACIYRLRQIYPLSTPADDPNRTGQQRTKDATSGISVVNGSKLLEDYRARRAKGLVTNWLTTTLNLFEEDNKRTAKIAYLTRILDWVDDEFDALTDVILSESVYKLTQGNTEAADAIARALDEMKNIPMPEVTEIPITSAQIDGHLVAMLPTGATAADPTCVLAAVEPKVDAWIEQMLYRPADLYAATVDEGPAPVLGTSLSLAALGVTASELVYLSADKASFAHFLELLTWLRTGTLTHIDLDADIVEADEEKHSLATCMMAVDDLRRVLTSAHALQNDDLVKETGLPCEALYDDLSATYHNLTGRIQRLQADIDGLLARQAAVTPEAPTPDDLVMDAVRALIDCYRLGHTSALDAVTPDALIGARRMIDSVTEWKAAISAQQTLFQALATVSQNLREKSAQAQQALAAAATPDWHAYAEGIKALLVTGYLVVPTFRPDGNVPLAELATQTRGGRFSNIDYMGIETAIAELALVEEPVMALHQVRMFQKVNGIDAPAVAAMQIVSGGKTAESREWLGAAVKDEGSVRDAFTYLVLSPEHVRTAAEAGSPALAGMVIDHWTDRIPYRDQTAAVAFGYDQPDAEAPQTLLLAVSTKDGRAGWSEQMLVNTMKSAIHMVKCRMVNPDMLASDGWAAGLFPLMEYRDLKK